MNTRRNFLKLGALFVPAVAAPRVAYSFLWERSPLVQAGGELDFHGIGVGMVLVYAGEKSGALWRAMTLKEYATRDHKRTLAVS